MAPRNVVLIVVDTLRADHTGLFGYERDTTPFLTALAKSAGATSFSRAFAPAPWTKPSLATILTGLVPEVHAVTRHPDRLHADFETLAERLGALGFETGAVQSNLLLASVFGFDQGFTSWNEAHLATHAVSTGPAINTAALEFLAARDDAARPFFLYVHHFEPHFQYLRSGAEWFPDYAGPLTGAEPMDALIGATGQLSAAEGRFLAARYDAEVRYQDQLLAELFAQFESLGLLADTLFVLTADHGEEFLEHGDLSHQFKLYDELVHVPLLFVDPRGEGAPLAQLGDESLTAPVGLVDLGATILDLLAVEGASSFPGTSLARPLVAAGPDPPVALSSSLVLGAEPPFAERQMLRIDHWKLIRTQVPGAAPTFEVFDLAADPGELRNLAPQSQLLVERLERVLEATLVRRRADGPSGERSPQTFEPSLEQLEKMRALGYL